MTKEYQEAANELAKENNINPITGQSLLFSLLLPYHPISIISPHF